MIWSLGLKNGPAKCRNKYLSSALNDLIGLRFHFWSQNQVFNLCQQFPLMPQLLDVAHVSKKGVSMRMTLPRIIRERLKIKDGDILGFYEDHGDIVIRKME